MTARKDNKGRQLRTGEGQKKDGRYYYKYKDINGKTRYKYSWKLTKSDRVPAGKSKCKALRDMEKEIMKDLNDEISDDGERMTVMELFDEYIGLREKGKSKNTQLHYKQKRGMIENDELSRMPITKINRSRAMEFMVRLSDKGYAFQTITALKSSMKGCFNLAIDDRYIRTNPFDFKIGDVLKNDTRKVVALTQSQVDSLLEFVRNDDVYKKHYNMIVLFLETGLRASELCGLTVKDVDLKNRTITIDHQLIYDSKNGYYISSLKTNNAYRQIPLSSRGYEAIKDALEERKESSFEVDGYKDFIFTKVRGESPLSSKDIDSFLRGLEKKYNMQNDYQMPHLHAHLLRHTFCSLCAQKNMNVKVLSKLMGHSTIDITLNVYIDMPQENINQEVANILG